MLRRGEGGGGDAMLCLGKRWSRDVHEKKGVCCGTVLSAGNIVSVGRGEHGSSGWW